MENKLFIVIADDKEKEDYYSSIIHKEYQLALFITCSDIIEEYGKKRLTFGLENLFDCYEAPALAYTYFIIIPPICSEHISSFWEKVDIFLHLGIEGLISVWCIKESHVAELFLRNVRIFNDRDSLESSLKQYVRAQKRYNPGNESLSFKIIENERELTRKNLYKDIPTQKFIPNDEYAQVLIYKDEIKNDDLEDFVMPKYITIFGSREADEAVKSLHFNLSQNQSLLKLGYNCNTWHDRFVFGNGHDTINALIKHAKRLKSMNGYAIFFFTPDDNASIRGEEFYISRDNVWLEYGLFSGVLDPSRTFAVCPKNPVKKNEKEQKWHTPSDFVIQRIDYSYSGLINDPDGVHLDKIANDIVTIIQGQQRNNEKPFSGNDDAPFGFDPKSK